MSVNFGFSLPALRQYGAAGSNPFGQLGPTLDLSFVDGATGVTDLSNPTGYTLNTDFITPEYQVAAQYAVWGANGLTQQNFADIVTFTRASAATQFDSTGTLVYAPMNAIRNNMMVGAVTGTPGIQPTNWQGTGSPVNGLTRQIVQIGTENGITYIDYKVSGTTTATSFFAINAETVGQVAALLGQTWTNTTYVSLIAGSTANILTFQIGINEYSSAPAFLTGAATIFTPTSGALNARRQTHTRTLTNASTASIQPYILFDFNNGVAIDITLRIGMPQLQLGSVATAVNATSGTAYYGPRFDYNPSTLAAQGLLIEESRTNSIRNNTAQGAVAGTPGTLPTNWQSIIVSGLTSTVVGTGTLNGITYLDVRVNGTASVSSYYNLVPDILVAGSSGQTWTGSFWAALVGGSLSNTNANIEIRESDASQGFLTNTLTLLSLTSSLARYSQARTLNSASTAFVSIRFVWQVTAGQPVDFTLRIGLPQLEQGAFATSVIPTTTTALTRSADVASVNTLSPWYNASAGTLFSEFVIPFDSSASIFPVAAYVSDGTFSSAVTLYERTVDDTRRGNIRVSGVQQFDQPNGGTYAYGTVAKTAIAFQTNDVAFSANGTSPTTSTSATIPTVNVLGLGSTNSLGGSLSPLNGWLRRITYYPRRLSNADLQTITT